MATSENKLSLKVLVDSKTKKVLFAEAGNDFVDVLLGFMTLPVGSIVRQLDKHLDKETSALGCLNNLYASVPNLSSSSFSTEKCKLMLLHPKNASEFECQKLKHKIDDSEPTKYYICDNSNSNPNRKTNYSYSYCNSTTLSSTIAISTPQIVLFGEWKIAIVPIFYPPPLMSNTIGGVDIALPLSSYSNVRCACGSLMNTFKTVSIQNQGGSSNEIFTAATKTFIISEDLRVMSTVKILNFQLLRNLVNGADVTEEHILDVGLKEIMLLLKLSLISSTPLTNFFHALRGDDTAIINPEPVFMVHSPQFLEAKTDCCIKLTALVQKLTCKALLSMAGDDLIELLFSILTIPLGSVVSLLGGRSSIGSVNNLYESISDLTSDFFRSSSVKDLLIDPKLPKHYMSAKTNKFFPLSEKPDRSGEVLIDPKGDQGYIKGKEAFMVTDDLVVTPLSYMSIMSYLSARSIPLSDVEELVFEIGTNEALDILRTSFTSSDSALSSALQMILKQPKKETWSM